MVSDMTALPAPLPGAVGLSHLSAYDWEAADGVCGGSPHLHLVCTEAYVVTGGRGAVQTLTVADGYRDTRWSRARWRGSPPAPCTAWCRAAACGSPC